MSQYTASWMFMGAHTLTVRAEHLVVFADSSKFAAAEGLIACDLSHISMVITDAVASENDLAMLRDRGVAVTVAAF